MYRIQILIIHLCFRSYFMNIWIISMSFLSQLVFNILPGRQPLEFHLCAGTDPVLESNEIKVNIILFAVYFLSAILNSVIPIQIHHFRLKSNKSCHSRGTLFAN